MGPQNCPQINKKPFFSSLFPMRFLIAKSCENVRKCLIFGDSGSCGEPFGPVKHRSKCTSAFSDIFAVFLESCSILSRFLTILASFLVPKSPEITENGASECSQKSTSKSTSKSGPELSQNSITSFSVRWVRWVRWVRSAL